MRPQPSPNQIDVGFRGLDPRLRFPLKRVNRPEYSRDLRDVDDAINSHRPGVHQAWRSSSRLHSLRPPGYPSIQSGLPIRGTMGLFITLR